jgi:hypothetical protein
MAEGTGIEPVTASLRSLGLASRRNATLPAFLVNVMVREGGFEPPKSPRSERGAFASLTTPGWCRRSDSNRHYTGPQPVDSANWPTTALMVGPAGFEPANLLLLRQPLCHLATGPWRKRRGSNSHPCEGRQFSRLLTLPTVHASERYSVVTREICYDSRNEDRLRSDRYERAVSRKVRIIRTEAILT